MQASILIVDDEPELRSLLTAILKKAGHACMCAENAAMAKNLLEEMHFDLLLTDLNMPGESGVDLIRYAKERYPHVAPVIVTVTEDFKQIRGILELGIYGYIIKPFTMNLVHITVENALRHHRLVMQEELQKKLLENEVAVRTKSLDEQLVFLQTLIDTIPVPIYYKNTNLEYLGCNRTFEKIANLDRNAIIGKTSADLHPPELAKSLERKDLELLKKGGVQIYETEIVCAIDNSRHATVIHKATFSNSDGVMAGLVGACLDITRLKRTEHSLRVSEEKFRSIMNNLHIGVAMINPQKELLHLNNQMQRWFPHAAQEGEVTWESLGSDQYSPQSCEDFPLKKTPESVKARESTVTLLTVDGLRMFRTVHSPIYDSSENLSAVIQIFEDITEKLAVERDLRQAQKLESIGQLAAGIAHEINTPMQYLGDNLYFLKDSFGGLTRVFEKYDRLLQALKASEETADIISDLETSIEQVDLAYLFNEIPDTLEQSLEGVDRVSAIVRAMRDFSHPGSEVKVHVDINRALENTLTVCRNEWKYMAEVKMDFDPNLPTLLCMPGEINQVFLNIIINAAHAIGEVTEYGGRGKGLIRVSTGTSGEWMEIRISDTGCGIPEEVQDRIFDPFFTTKKVGKGTGQGLAIARNVVVDKHQGKISFETEVGKSTTFIIRLPMQ